MAESNTEKEQRGLRELEGKNIAHYQTLLSAWIDTRMERDKTIITLSALAIGLLVTILTTVGIYGTLQKFSVGVAFISFVLAIWSGLKIYELNANHLEDCLREKNNESLKLERFDKCLKILFCTGVISMILLGIIPFFKKEKKMSDSKANSSQQHSLKESLNKIQKLSPKSIEGGFSVNGVQKLSPQNLAPKSSSQGEGSTSKANGSESQGHKK